MLLHLAFSFAKLPVMTEFKQLWADMTPAEKTKLACQLESSNAYLSQVANGHRNPGKSMRKLINMFTGQVNRFVTDEVHED